MKIVIVGGGIIGLSTGLYLLRHPPNNTTDPIDITIVTEKITPQTTADGAAGIWGPYLLDETPEDQQHRWAKETHDFIADLWSSGEGGRQGISLVSSTRLNLKDGPPIWHDIVYGFRKMGDKEVAGYGRHEGTHSHGYEFVTFTIEPILLLPHFLKEFIGRGGKVKTGVHVSDLSVLGADYDLVINCTGVWARNLVGDERVGPLRGQVARVEAPWIKKVVLDDRDDGKYIIPNQNSVVLGGTHQSSWDTTPSDTDRSEILHGSKQLRRGDVSGARFLKDWVGLRPGRPAVRLEREKMKRTEVIHSYGHGGSGITIFWGCAKEVQKLVQDVALENGQAFYRAKL